MKICRLPEKLKTIVFDIDSTLYTNDAYVSHQNEVQLRRFAKVRGISEKEARTMFDDYRSEWSKAHGGKKISEVLQTLKNAYELVCVTNNPVGIGRRTLAALGVEDCIAFVIGLDTFGKSKPVPEPFEEAARRTDAAIEECLSVGDRYDIDIALPLEMGMGGILVEGVSDVYELPNVLSVSPK